MATFKAIIYKHHLKKDGTYNVKIRIIHKKAIRNPSTNIFVEKDEVTKNMRIKNQAAVDAIDDIVRRCRQKCNEYSHRLGDMDVDQVLALVADIIGGRHESKNAFDIDFITYARSFIQKMRDNGRVGNAKNYNVAVNNLVKFVGRAALSIHEITSRFIQNWIEWIRAQPPQGAREQRGYAQRSYPSYIRSIHNAAKREYNDEELGIIRIPLSPFKKVEIPCLPERRERALDAACVRSIFTLPYENSNRNSTFNLAKDMFMLSFMLVGINAADLYHCTDCKDGRLTYRRQKVMNTRADKGKISIKIEPEARALIDKYSDPAGVRTFRFYKMFASVGTFSGSINGFVKKGKKGVLYRGLKKIGALLGIDDLEYYAARHSWASIARNDLDIDKYTVHLALNHVDNATKITDAYLKTDWSPIDRANRRVLDYIFKEMK